MDKRGGFMYEIANKTNKLKSLSLFVGTGLCNANCAHCAGVPLRKYAPEKDGIINQDLIYKTIKTCHKQGARFLSISSSGEPTLSPLSVTKVLQIIHKCKKENIQFKQINLYSNGIRIGKNKNFCEKYLALWSNLGLTTIYLTIHDIDEKKNAKIYGVKDYPALNLIISRIHNANLSIRANLVLSKKNNGTFENFITIIKHLKKIGINSVSAWVIRNLQDEVDKNLAPNKKEIDKIIQWIKKENLEDEVRLLIGKKSRQIYQKGQKLTLFPDGTLSNTWCNY